MDVSCRSIAVGNPHWEKVFSIFFKDPRLLEGLTVTIHPRSKETGGRIFAVLYTDHYSSSAVGENVPRTLIKALGELGEGFIMKANGWNNRSGVAGGLTRISAAQRAKNEVIERDAFFYHYRNQIPFLKCIPIEGADCLAFIMASADPKFHSVFVTDKYSATGTGECLLFGSSANSNLSTSIEKARDEYEAIKFNHHLRPSLCADQEKGSHKISNVADFHHVASRDERNRKRLQQLCAPSLSGKIQQNRRNIAGKGWKVEVLESPFHLLKYVRVTHPELKELQFMVPEVQLETEKPLFHPYW